MGIKPEDLIAKFQYALDNNWGYIIGKSGGVWTQKAQNAATDEMAKKYGQRWVGHRVADCSGLFAWAFKQLGGKMYHGSNTMWLKWCTTKGALDTAAKKTLKPGTAVFKMRNESDYYHVGLYIGNGEVIEDQSTQNGVVKSKLNRWGYWGQLKGVDYEKLDTLSPVEPESPSAAKVDVGERRIIKWGMTGNDVKELQKLLIAHGYEVSATGKYAGRTLKAVTNFQESNGLAADGIVGQKTWSKLLA